MASPRWGVKEPILNSFCRNALKWEEFNHGRCEEESKQHGSNWCRIASLAISLAECVKGKIWGLESCYTFEGFKQCLYQTLPSITNFWEKMGSNNKDNKLKVSVSRTLVWYSIFLFLFVDVLQKSGTRYSGLRQVLNASRDSAELVFMN